MTLSGDILKSVFTLTGLMDFLKSVRASFMKIVRSEIKKSRIKEIVNLLIFFSANISLLLKEDVLNNFYLNETYRNYF